MTVREDVRRAVGREDDPIGVHRAAAARLARAVPYDRWCGFTVDPATLMATVGYHEDGLPFERMPRLLEIECTDDANVLPQLVRTSSGVSTIDRATGGRPQRSRRWAEVLEPSGLGRELRAVLRDRGVVWGGLVLFRESGAPDFADEELRVVAETAEEIARGLRRALLLSELRHRDAPDLPGVAIFEVTSEATPVVVSEAARRWLAEVDDGTVPGTDLPFVLFSVVASARSARHGAQARLRTRAGRWVTLHAEALPDDRVSVVIEPTRPYELAALICDAYGLTPRERDVARLVVSGYSNREAAQALWLSQWTVQDHLKKVFDKLGVTNRSALVAKLFFDQYAPRIMADRPVGADGWFIDR